MNLAQDTTWWTNRSRDSVHRYLESLKDLPYSNPSYGAENEKLEKEQDDDYGGMIDCLAEYAEHDYEDYEEEVEDEEEEFKKDNPDNEKRVYDEEHGIWVWIPA